MFVTAVQGVVGTFHENLTPLDQASGGETRNRTDNYFLDKGRVHPLFKSTRSAMIKSGLERCRRPIRLGGWLLTSTRPGSIQLCGPALKLPHLTKTPIDGSALSTNQGVNWLRRGRERTKPDFGCDRQQYCRARPRRTRLTNPRASD
jgi:hypothetical protein